MGERLTISVPEAGRRLGIGRNHSYECARRGELPVIRLGNKLVVPIAALERMLLAVESGGDDDGKNTTREPEKEPEKPRAVPGPKDRTVKGAATRRTQQ